MDHRVFQRSAAGGGNDRLVLPGVDVPSLNLIPTDWSPDGDIIFLGAPGPRFMAVAAQEEGKPAKLIASPAPDARQLLAGRWLVAYTSNETGKFEVYVETVPRSDRRWPVSTRWIRAALAGGWTRDLLFVRRPEAHGRLGRRGSVVRHSQPLFQTRVHPGVTALPHALRAQPRRPAVPRQRGVRYGGFTDHRRAQLDGDAEKMSVQHLLQHSAFSIQHYQKGSPSPYQLNRNLRDEGLQPLRADLHPRFL